MRKETVNGLGEIQAEISALGQLFWHITSDIDFPDNFGWGMGLLLNHVEQDIEALI